MAWFVEGLVDVLEGIDKLRRRRVPFRMASSEAGYALERPGQGAPAAALHLVPDKAAPQLAPSDSAAILADQDIDILRPSAELIVRPLDPLPADSRPYLDGIVRHHIERLMPWRADDVLFSYRVAEAGAGDNRLAVTISATSRAFSTSLIAALNAIGVGRLRLIFAGSPEAGDEIVIPVNGDIAAQARRTTFRRAILVGLGLLLFTGAAGTAYLLYAWDQTSTTVESAESSIAVLRKQLLARGPQHPGQGRDIDALLARRRATPFAVLAINDIASALPDTTSLTELKIGDGRMRISGISRDVAELVPLIEAVPMFGEARFFAPTTRLTNGAGDRFYLEMRLNPGSDKAR